MNDDHPVLTTVGIAAVALGVLMVVQPGLAATIGVDYAAVLLIGVIALVQGLRVARARQRSEIRSAETPDVETVETMPTPGDEFDETVASLRSGPRRVLIRERADLRETLEDAAITAVADRENCSREAAGELIEDGSWTDDVHAAALLGGSAAPSPPLFDRLKLAASAQSSFQFRVRRTADAVARAADVVADEDDSDEGAIGEGSSDEDDSDHGATGDDGSSSNSSSSNTSSVAASGGEAAASPPDAAAEGTDGRAERGSRPGRGGESDAKSDPDQSNADRWDPERSNRDQSDGERRVDA
ncbi:DUF308 domain-containing protein [Halorussus litoreus]|uniref:DUF308 domain-containing protein n=1 Tax=Halorussus litoreus TaxID=1710536 RepID=UPI000E27C0CC|nr:DUF308 domain-containing protein [Halorussus litoreus]